MALILVEGASDRRAVERVARLRGIDLDHERVDVVSMNGITNLERHLDTIPPSTRVSGLYDVAEAGYVRAVVAQCRCGGPFFACDRDLEDELIRALGPDRVRAVIHAAGDDAAWRTLRSQPFHRARSEVEVLRRFMGTTSGRKLRYAGLLVEAMEPAEVPEPLTAVVDAVIQEATW